MNHRYSKYQKQINLIGDVLFLNTAFFGVYYIVFNVFSTLYKSQYFELLLFFNISWLIVAYLLKIHDKTRTQLFENSIRQRLNALGLYLVLIFAFLGIKGGDYYKPFVFYAYSGTSISLSVLNIGLVLFYKYYRKVGYNYRNVIIIGYGEISRELRKFFTFNPEHGFRFLGYFDNNSDNPNIKGRLSKIKEYCDKEDIDEIYCVLPYLDFHEVEKITKYAEDNFIKIRMIPDFRGFPYKNIEVQIFDYIPVLNFPTQPLDDLINRFMKRTFDFLFSLFFIVFIMTWLVPIIGILIKLDSKGSVFFKQKRSGINNNTFICYKFRTMRSNQEADVKQATKEDLRITRVGSFLRKTNLDEIPQFINVLLGDMSVVGPRPHMLKHTEEFSKQVDKFMLRHYVRPGITGLAQAKGYRGETNTYLKLKNRIKLDRFYVENWSLIFDLKILFLTFLVMLKGDDNAY